MKPLADHRFADTIARYFTDDLGCVGLMLFPASMEPQLAQRRLTLRGEPEIDAAGGDPPTAIALDPLVHVKLLGDAYSGAFAQGHTMRSSPSNDRLRLNAQRAQRSGDRTTVLTTLTSNDGLRVEHRLSWHDTDAAAEVQSTFINGSSRPVTLEMFSSFSLCGITPFDPADAANRLRVHRFRSVWSAEGRLEMQTIEQLHLERSWSGAAVFSERFGQVGSMPVRRYFPCVAIEDTVAQVTWGAQLAWAGSWQMEISRQHDDVCLSGGLADREFGHWMKTLAPGESLTSPAAVVACVTGGLDEVCDCLTAMQHRAADAHPAIERDLPIVFNEWCTTWGDPSHDKVLAIADRLRNTATRYLVIDAGWYKGETGDWSNAHGDWIPSPRLFPHGLEATARAIRERGLIPGLWFEMETVGDSSAAFSLVDHLLRRDGLPLTVRSRRFWDLCDPAAVDYLSTRVTDLLERCGFGYLKVDYNETIGLGCDHPDSIGEGLRRQTEGTYRFFDRIRQRLPELVIESCASGGHRLEPSMIGRSAMSSFSDAHELREIPIIAANLHRLMLPRQSQVWAVLRSGDSDARLIYSLAATFLGRMCLSGEIDRLTDAQMQLVHRAQALYQRCAPIIKHGTTRRFGAVGDSWRHPRGWQGVLRLADDGNSAMAIIHAFADPHSTADLPLPAADWSVVDQLNPATPAHIEADHLHWCATAPFTAQVLLLSRGCRRLSHR